MKVIIFISCLPVSFSCSQITSESHACTEQEAINAGLEAYYDDMSHRDWNAYRGHFWPNATITTSWVRPGDSLKKVHVITIDDFIRETPNGPDSQPVFEERMTRSRIECAGNLAVVWADYSARFGKPDSLLEWQGRCICLDETQ